VNIDDMPTSPMGGDEGAEETKSAALPKQVEFDPSQVPLAGAEDPDMPPSPPMLRERSDSMASDASEPEHPYEPEDNISAPGTLVRAPKLIAYGKSKTIEAFVDTMDVFLDGAGEPRDYWERKKGLLFCALLDMVHCNKMQDALALLQMMDPANTQTYDSRSQEELDNIKDERFREMSVDLEAMIAVEEDARKKQMEEAKLEYVAPEKVTTPYAVPDSEKERGLGFIPDKLLHRLNDAYDNSATSPAENAMWIADFVKALAMMGKSFDAVDQKAKFKTACRFQHKIDEQLRNYLLDEYDRDMDSESYKPRYRYFADKMACEQALFTQMQPANRKPVKEMVVTSSCFGFGGGEAVAAADDSVNEIESVAAKEKEALRKRRLGRPNISVSMPSGVDLTFDRPDTPQQLKEQLRTRRGIPESHIRIQHMVKLHILSDAEFCEVHEVKVERPISRVAWINFFIDELVMDVEEDEVMEHWKRICEITRKARNDETFDEKAEGEEMFCYAEDLRKLMTSFGDKMGDEEADLFIRECNAMTTREMNAKGTLSDADYRKPDNRLDLLPRIYHEQYYNALTDDTL